MEGRRAYNMRNTAFATPGSSASQQPSTQVLSGFPTAIYAGALLPNSHLRRRSASQQPSTQMLPKSHLRSCLVASARTAPVPLRRSSPTDQRPAHALAQLRHGLRDRWACALEVHHVDRVEPAALLPAVAATFLGGRCGTASPSVNPGITYEHIKAILFVSFIFFYSLSCHRK